MSRFAHTVIIMIVHCVISETLTRIWFDHWMANAMISSLVSILTISSVSRSLKVRTLLWHLVVVQQLQLATLVLVQVSHRIPQILVHLL